MSFRHEAPVVPVTWYIVVDRSRVRIVEAVGPPEVPWRLLESWDFVEGRLQPREALSDRQGAFRSSIGSPHPGAPSVDYAHATGERLADQIVERLERGRNTQEFGRLVLAAPPMMLGILRQKLTGPLAKMVAADLDRDLTHLEVPELRDHLREAGVAV